MRLTLTALASLVITQFVALGLEPDFLYPLENLTIAQGRDAMFTCVVNNLGGYRVAWIKADTKAILAIHEHVITNNQRLSVTHNDDNTWTLNMRGVKREDRGTYMCQVNTDPMKSQSAYLEVVIPPDIVYEETSGDMMIPEGGSAKLVCKARGFPPPRITWRREDGGDIILRDTSTGHKSKVITVEGETLTLSKVTRSEMGVYMCIASNGVPPTVSKRLMLHVHFHPLIQVPNQLVGAPAGTDVKLQCQVEASPKAINYWTKQSGEMIVRSPKYKMEEEAGPYYTATMYLTVRDIHKSDLGGYKCVSKNSIGDAEGNIRLYDFPLPGGGSINDDDDEDEDNDVRRDLDLDSDSEGGSQDPLREEGGRGSGRVHGGQSASQRGAGSIAALVSFLFLILVAP